MTAQLSRERLEEIAGLELKTTSWGYEHAPDAYGTVPSSEIVAMARMLLAAMDSEPVAWVMADDLKDKAIISTPAYPSLDDAKDMTIGEIVPLYAAPPAPVAVPDDVDSLRRDANRYRFLRDKDAFGEENEPGLVTWGELTELELNEFDAAIDARMNHPNVAWVQPVKCADGDSMAEVYAELYRLREEVKGPEGFATWKDAAIAERISKKSARNIPDEIDYLHAMAAFHSDQWHKMGPITGYMHGWNACRAAMLKGDK